MAFGHLGHGLGGFLGKRGQRGAVSRTAEEAQQVGDPLPIDLVMGFPGIGQMGQGQMDPL